MFHHSLVTDDIPNILQLGYRPWKDDPLCRNHVIRFINNCDQPLTALVSFPGSGNTYTRGMIERLTGFFTGSLYTDKDHYISGKIYKNLSYKF